MREKTYLRSSSLNSPFKTASLGWYKSFPNENSVLIRGEGDRWKEFLKVDLINNDTVVYIDSLEFNWKGNDIFVSSLTFSKNGKKILIGTDKEKLWRHSHKATYFVYDIKTRNLFPVSSQNKNLRNVKFSPNGKYVSYVRDDNNIYVFNTKSLKEKQLTRTGNEKILNGHFGWLYEEELTGYDGYRWSPDSKYISFWEEDQSDGS